MLLLQCSVEWFADSGWGKRIGRNAGGSTCGLT